MEAMVVLLTIGIILAVIGLAMSAFGRAKGAAGAREMWPSMVLGTAGLVSMGLGMLVPALVEDEPLQTILRWVLLVAALCFTAVDVAMHWRKWWRAIADGARMSE